MEVTQDLLAALRELISLWDEFNEGECPGNFQDAYYIFSKGRAFAAWEQAIEAVAKAQKEMPS